MGVSFTISHGFGYVIPKNALTEAELELLYDFLESDDDDRFTFLIQQTDGSRIFICFRDDLKTIVHMCGSYDPKFEYNCQEFAVRCYYGEDEYQIKNFDEEAVEKEHKEFLVDRRADLDHYLEENVAWLYEKLMEGHQDCYEEWLFGCSS